MKKYNPKIIEKKWQKIWEEQNNFKAQDNSKNLPAGRQGRKFYLLVEFPYPSGDGLHVGHCRPYIALDILARKRRMDGYNVLFPIGWDAFGLPTENYAIKKGIHPAAATKKNTDNFRRQIKNIGISFDWAREVNTTDPEYYKWTQWIFLQLFKNGLAYKAKIDINWCPSCKIGLANEEVVLGKCERCGEKVEKKEKDQWLIKITEYAERLIEDLDLVDYLEKIKIQQKEWIGKSEGALVKFLIEGDEDYIKVFTTRIDTIFSGTFLILAPEHKFIDKHKDKIQNLEEVLQYRNSAKTISDMERTNEKKSFTGVELKGITARNPATGEEMPVWIADFVLEKYGPGADFADDHDKRDFELAKKYGIPLRTSIEPADKNIAPQVKTLEICYEGDGTLYNSMQFNGLSSAEARPKIISWLKEKGMAEIKTSYKLRDWIFSRQHYWGEPIPLVYCESCRKKLEASSETKNQNFNLGERINPGWIALQEDKLPIELPKVKNYKPTKTGESPLAEIKKWVNVKCNKCGNEAKRETDTMPNWAGSNWYYLAYTMPRKQNLKNKNKKYVWDERKMKNWMPVDWYNGGMEHTTLHLLYSRFIFKFLWDIGVVPKSIGPEPYKKRTSHGMILGEGGIKMSKSKGNVINPDKVVKEYGADTLRIYEMFMGPFDQMIPWDIKGVVGSRRFIEKIYRLANSTNFNKSDNNKELKKVLHRTIRKVTEDINAIKFNTAVSSMMEFINACNISGKDLDKNILKDFLKILSPFAPHLAEELWFSLGFEGMCCSQKWPKYNVKLIEEEKAMLVVQINGKVRDKIEVDASITQKEAEKIALKSEKIKQWLNNKEIKKVIFVPGRLINFVIADG